MRLDRRCLVSLLIVVMGCAPAVSEPEEAESRYVHIQGLGSLAFPNSGAEEAQDSFLRGVLLMHSFEFGPAAEAFRAAQDVDPDFALAYWGEAMTYNHPLWQEQDGQAAMVALGRLGATAEERAAKAPTERERMYLDALEALYAETGSKRERDQRYMDAMRRLHEAYPEDEEAQAFYALSILGSRDGSRDFATYVRAAATAQPVFEANPDHPGAAHYLIHSFDDPVHAPLGLPAARAYSGVAPAAAHAQHMTTHIFVAMGMWDDVVAGNIRARDVQDAEFAEAGRGANLCGHYSSWLHYGRLMLGQVAEAEALMDGCHAGVVEGNASPVYFALMRARQILDTEEWSLAERWQAELSSDGSSFTGASAGFLYDFTNAFAALRGGDTSVARAFVAANGDSQEQAERIQVAQIAGLIALDEGRDDEGIALLRDAAEEEDSMPFAFGPPVIVKPTFELLGEELLRLARTDEAAAAFQRAAERTPGRTLAERGRAAVQSAP